MPTLRSLGVDALYGAALDGVDVVQVPLDLAPLLAETHARLRRRPAGIHQGDGVVVPVGAAPGERWLPPAEEVVSALGEATAPVVLAGPGVVADDAVAGLHALAVAGSLGVLNTWGAKGIFDWRSRHHLATVGLQQLDFVRGGLGEADLILATGIDDREAIVDWRLAPVVEVAPASLGPIAEQLNRPRRAIALPPLRADLARVTQAGWTVDTGPLPPSCVTRNYATVLGAGGLVAADPGVAGYWLARTYATTGLGGVHVPSDPAAVGFAIACVIVTALFDPSRRALAVVDGIGPVHERLLGVAERLQVPVAVEVWSDDGEALDAEAHVARLLQIVVGGGRNVVATDPSQLEEMVEVAGPIVAWSQGRVCA